MCLQKNESCKTIRVKKFMEDSSIHQNHFNSISALQDELLNIDFQNENELILLTEKLLSSSLLNSELTFRSTLISIYTCYLSRPLSNDNYIDLFIKIAKHPNNHFTSDDYVANFSNKFFIYKLYKADIVTLASIYSKSQHYKSFFDLFFPEIQKNYPDSRLLTKESYDRMRNSVTIEGYQYNDEDLQSYYDKFFEFRSKGQNPNLIATYIRNDDVEQLQKMLSQTNTSVNTTIKRSIFDRHIYVENDEPNLIEYACYFGSVKCFKFLYQQVTTIPESISIFAVAGGCYEIIHIIERSQVEFSDKSLMTSIRFFRPEITSYLEETLNIEKTIDDACQAIIYYNLRSLVDCEDIIRQDPNKHESRGHNPLILASMNGDIDVVKYLITTFEGIDVNAKENNGNTALLFSSFKGHLQIVKFLSSLPNIDLNAKNNNKYTPLHYACRGDKIDVVKFLCSLPNIDINADCDRNLRPIDIAAKNGNIELINFLAQLPNAIIYDTHCVRRSLIEHSVASKKLEVVKLVLNLIDQSLSKSKIQNLDKFKNTDMIYHRHMMNAYNDAFEKKLTDIINFFEADIFGYYSSDSS